MVGQHRAGEQLLTYADPAADPAAPADPLARLSREPWAFDFFRAVRLIEATVPDGDSVGYARRPEDDKCRFRHHSVMSFAPANLAKFDRGTPGGIGPVDPGPGDDGPAELGGLVPARAGPGRAARQPPTLWSHFLGLLGADCPMPPHLYRLDREARGTRGPVLPAFFDVFHHRMLSLFYRAWGDGEMTVNYQHAATAAARRGGGRAAPHQAGDHGAGDADRFRVFLGSLIGLGTPALWDRDAVPDEAKLHYAGRLACPTRNAEGLAAILADYFAVPVTVEPFVRQWIDLPAAEQCKLGGSDATSALGTTAVLGDQVLDVQQRFRLVLGPMTLADFKRLLPGGPSLGRLRAWVLTYVGGHLDWDARLVLRGRNVPACRLGGDRQLGHTTWLGDWPGDRDAGDLVVSADLN